MALFSKSAEKLWVLDAFSQFPHLEISCFFSSSFQFPDYFCNKQNTYQTIFNCINLTEGLPPRSTCILSLDKFSSWTSLCIFLLQPLCIIYFSYTRILYPPGFDHWFWLGDSIWRSIPRWGVGAGGFQRQCLRPVWWFQRWPRQRVCWTGSRKSSGKDGVSKLCSTICASSYVTIHHETGVKLPLGHFHVISRKYMS